MLRKSEVLYLARVTPKSWIALCGSQRGLRHFISDCKLAFLALMYVQCNTRSPVSLSSKRCVQRVSLLWADPGTCCKLTLSSHISRYSPNRYSVTSIEYVTRKSYFTRRSCWRLYADFEAKLANDWRPFWTHSKQGQIYSSNISRWMRTFFMEILQTPTTEVPLGFWCKITKLFLVKQLTRVQHPATLPANYPGIYLLKPSADVLRKAKGGRWKRWTQWIWAASPKLFG